MIISKFAIVKWNPTNKKYYIDKGYVFTKMKESFEVKVEDLYEHSTSKIQVMCDYCNRVYDIEYRRHYSNTKIVPKDCCNNNMCIAQKVKDVNYSKYGVISTACLDEVKAKIKNTNIKKYGAKNPFESEVIKKKIIKTNMEKYGVPSPMQTKEVQLKVAQTCLKKYGVDAYIKLDKFKNLYGEKSPRWKGNNVKHERTERYDPRYRIWRTSVFKRDHYTCQCCGRTNKKGNKFSLYLVAHHLNNFKNYIDERYDVDNGITLCVDCHKAFHHEYGIKDTTKEMFSDYRRKQIIE